jgi:hypothetical protein
MIHLALTGDYAQIGEQHGRAISAGGDFTLPPPNPERLPFVRQCEEVLERFAPELLEEMQAFAQAAGVDYDALATISITAPLQQTGFPSCTVLALTPERTADGRLIFGRNYDFIYDMPPSVTYRTYPTGRYASLGNCDIWIGCEDGLNEAGLFVAIAATMLPGFQPGFTFWFVVRMMLDRCATVDEGLELIQSVPHAQSRNFLLADRSGKAVVAEATIEGVEVREPEDGLLIITNHAASPALAEREAFIPPDSYSRYNRLRELLGGKKQVDLEMVKSALRDHEGLLCSHWPDGTGGTLWSIVGHPDERQLELAEGHPCDMPYQTVSF